MKAATINRYGSPEDIRVTEHKVPVPKDDEVLVKVKASAINDYDWSLVRGKPDIYRLIFGIAKPRNPIFGMELSGVVEKVGSAVKGLKVGDRVFADTSDDRFGTFAEYIALKEKTLTLLPDAISFAEGAALPHASMLAYQGLYDLGGLQPGMDVLINGAGGGVGSFALSIAKQKGCRVTGVDTGSKLNNMLEWGYDSVIDYRAVDFTQNSERYDLILDAKTSRMPGKHIRVLKESGVYVTVGGFLPQLLSSFLHQITLSKFASKKVKVLAVKVNQNNSKIADMVQSGQIKLNIDKYQGLDSVAKALADFGAATHSGKVVVEI